MNLFFFTKLADFVVKSLHFLERKNFTYDATETANQKLNRKNPYLQTLTIGEKISLLLFK